MIFLLQGLAPCLFLLHCRGPGSGFDLFIICVFFSIFLVKNITLASRKVIYALYAFAFVTLISMQLAPSCFDLSMFRVYLTEDQTSFIFLVNSVLSFIMVLFLSIIFLDDVEKDKKILKRQNARLLELARVDSLTGLLNRRAMKQRLESAFYAKSNYGVEFVVAIMDIDNFKQINDEFGHSCGDQVIKKLASIVQRKIRETDYVCRWGGDEILILLNKSSLDGAVSTMKRIYYQISNTKIKYEQETINITVTIGICSSKDYYLLQDIIVEADRRLYRGKRKGKNRIVCSSDD